MSDQLVTIEWHDATTADAMTAELSAVTAPYVLIRHRSIAFETAHVDALVALIDQPQAASVSPIELDEAPPGVVTAYDLAPGMPPPPTVFTPAPHFVVVRADVLAALQPRPGTTWGATWAGLCTDVVNRGWRHVAATGLAMPPVSWDPPPNDDGGWDADTVGEVNGAANEGLATHRLYGATRFRALSLVVDAACFDASPSNGTQALVTNVAQALAEARRHKAVVSVAVPADQLEAATAEFEGRGVGVVARDRSLSAPDVVYRPYQLLVPAELDWLVTTGRRLVVGQLDMIGYSNPSYHPSSALFHAVRNLQRATLRAADAVTFISDFGLKHAIAECPDVSTERCFVVSSGVDSPPDEQSRDDGVHTGDRGTSGLADRHSPYLLCLSASFWHKNRSLAIEMFEDLVQTHGYRGDLLIAGPEPFYGSSSAADRNRLAQMSTEVAQRVHLLGRVTTETKWDLLRHADLVVYPSTVEGFGMIPFEAARVGTPCLVGQDSALSEIFGETGALVRSWRARDWAAEAARIVSDRRAADAIASTVGSLELSHTWSLVAAKTWDAIDATLSRPRASLHVEEGGWRSQVVGTPHVAHLARSVHFGNRAIAYVGRRFGRS